MFLFGFLNSKGGGGGAEKTPEQRSNISNFYFRDFQGQKVTEETSDHQDRPYVFLFFLLRTHKLPYAVYLFCNEKMPNYALSAIYFYKYWSATINISSQALSYSMVICLSLFFCPMNRDLEDHVDHKDWGDQKEKW